MDYIPIIGGIFSLSMVKKVYKCKKQRLPSVERQPLLAFGCSSDAPYLPITLEQLRLPSANVFTAMLTPCCGVDTFAPPMVKYSMRMAFASFDATLPMPVVTVDGFPKPPMLLAARTE